MIPTNDGGGVMFHWGGDWRTKFIHANGSITSCYISFFPLVGCQFPPQSGTIFANNVTRLGPLVLTFIFIFILFIYLVLGLPLASLWQVATVGTRPQKSFKLLFYYFHNCFCHKIEIVINSIVQAGPCMEHCMKNSRIKILSLSLIHIFRAHET